MPAVILEPWFASNFRQAALYNSDKGVAMAAGLIKDLVDAWCKPGSLIALSIGHLGKTSNPSDAGAAIFNTPSGLYSTEGHWAHRVVHHAAELLRKAQIVDDFAPDKSISLRIHADGGEEDYRLTLERGVKYTLTVG